jgi:uncharacterized YccA/Bax inhibitor family protein
MESSSNPALQEKNINRLAKTFETSDSMTISGTLSKIGLLLAIVSIVGAWSWNFTSSNIESAGLLTIGASIAALIIALIIIFKSPSPLLIVTYTALQGIVIGSVSFLFGEAYQGIVAQAILFTISITLGMLFLFATRLVTVTQKLRSMILIATVGVLLFYVLSFIIGLFSPSFAEFVSSGTSGVVIAFIIVIIAALNLLLDFDFIEKGAEKELPKQFEWYGAFGIMVTLIWLYFSILRLLAASRR